MSCPEFMHILNSLILTSTKKCPGKIFRNKEAALLTNAEVWFYSFLGLGFVIFFFFNTNIICKFMQRYL